MDAASAQDLQLLRTYDTADRCPYYGRVVRGRVRRYGGSGAMSSPSRSGSRRPRSWSSHWRIVILSTGGRSSILDNGCEEVAPPTTTTATTTATTTGTATGTTTTATTTVPPTTTAAPSPTIGSPPSPAGGPPPGRPIPSGAVDAGGTGLNDQPVDPSVASILLISGGLLLGVSTAFTVRWRRYSR